MIQLTLMCMQLVSWRARGFLPLTTSPNTTTLLMTMESTVSTCSK